MVEDHSQRDVRETFDTIAEHFAETRHHPWPEITGFLTDIDRVERALDVGCGNGRHSELLTDVADEVLAVDASRRLLDTARERVGDEAAGSLLQGDASRLPVQADAIDLALYVATIHHLPSRAARLASLDELGRMLRPDGRALAGTWSTAHDRFDADADAEAGFDTIIEWTLPGGETVDRFHHIYAPAEFRADIEASWLAIESFEISSGNCYAVLRPKGKRP
jgi:ubiquinone/menaquinone biosynthesis C-methylase UbiE